MQLPLGQRIENIDDLKSDYFHLKTYSINEKYLCDKIDEIVYSK